jgi:hypothetical protein
MRDHRIGAVVQPRVALLVPRIDAGQVEVRAALCDIERRDGAVV